MVGLAAQRYDIPSSSLPLHQFGIRTHADPHALLQVANLFAKLMLTPHQISCRMAEAFLVMDVEIAIKDAAALNLLDDLRSLPIVDRASLVERIG